MHFILPYFIILIIILQFAIKRSSRNHKSRNQQFLERESRANQVRRKDISNLNYISIPDNLPLINSGNETFNQLLSNNSGMMRSYNTITGLKDKKILNLTGISNTELKLSYGAANLTELTEYDDNFTTLIKAIASLGHALIDNNDTADALSFLEYGISIGSDISSNYIDLAIIYAATDRFDDIRKLKDSPITPPQRRYLAALVEKHNINLEIPVEEMTKSMASRQIDTIIAQYGK